MNENARTKRLYYDDPYLLEFEAAVIETTEHEGKTAVILDRTAFYPESGGQPWDTGTLGGAAVLQIMDREDGDIIHVLDHAVGVGPVRGLVDKPRRFDHMQQHTGQHILSQAFYETLKGETRSFHLGPDVSTLEIGLGSITDRDLERVEKRANQAVWDDIEVKSYFVPEERIAEVPLRRPPKKHGLLRVIEVAGFDYSACGGTHVRRTGEVGLIKVTGSERIRGNLRFEFVCGGRALTDYTAKDIEMKKISGLFSSSPVGTFGFVEKLSADSRLMKKKMKELAERLAAFEAAEIMAKADGKTLTGLLEGRSADEARALVLNLSKLGPVYAAFGTVNGEQGHLVCARHASLGADLRQLSAVVGAVVPVKGGGGPSLVELVILDGKDTLKAVDMARTWLEQRNEG